MEQLLPKTSEHKKSSTVATEGSRSSEESRVKVVRLGAPVMTKKPDSTSTEKEGRSDLSLKELEGVAAEPDPALISGFLGVERVDTALRQERMRRRFGRALHRNLRFVAQSSRLEATSVGVTVFTEIELDPDLLADCELFFHSGLVAERNSSDSQRGWCNEQFVADEIKQIGPKRFALTKVLSPEVAGEYAGCFLARRLATKEFIWSSQLGVTDLQFEITEAQCASAAPAVRLQLSRELSLASDTLDALESYESFAAFLDGKLVKGNQRRFGRLLYEATRDHSELRRLISQYYERAQKCLREIDAGQEAPPLETQIVDTLGNIGIGEFVQVTPEGPHAIAGGLAQVIVGLSKTLSDRQIATTIISPLYEYSDGNRHSSAEELLENGIDLLGERVPLIEQQPLKLLFGPTKFSGTATVMQFPELVKVQVYLAKCKGVRVFLLRNSSFADRLYNFTTSEDQLRKALFLSRGALELMLKDRYDIHPDIIFSNDWLAALVPTLLRCDPRYAEHGRFAAVETAHVLHNAGRAYQGRLYTNQYGEDVWPLIGIANEHFFGLRDPENPDSMNLTSGAIVHSSKAVLTVSQPYAEQLLTKEAGEGLHTILQNRRNSVFGISNGVDLSALRRIFADLVDKQEEGFFEEKVPECTNGVEQTPEEKKLQQKLLTSVFMAKAEGKYRVQSEYSLNKDADAILISLVGRLSEQKGVQLLTAFASPEGTKGRFVCEEILERSPRVQFLVAGPLSASEEEIQVFKDRFSSLAKAYPGRVAFQFDFLPHRKALAITQASDLFLMPSRYEPGGITQLEALAAGTPVVARNVGGIAATLTHYSHGHPSSNAFLFTSFDALSLQTAISHAVSELCKPEVRDALVWQALNTQSDWKDRIESYLALFQYISLSRHHWSSYRHLTNRRMLLEESTASACVS